MKNPTDVLVRALISEKGTRMRESSNKYVFHVHRDANKIEIKYAVERVFDVRVKQVRTMNFLGKVKRMGANMGPRPAWKKAVVTLAEGDSIELFEEV